MARAVRIALLQMTAGRDRQANLALVLKAVEAASDQGATLLATPEMSLKIDKSRAAMLADSLMMDADPVVEQLGAAARVRGMHLLLGSAAFRVGADRLLNRSLLFGPDGGPIAHYDKIHLFDVDLDHGESWRESNSYQGGDHAVLADAGFARIGLSICYDLRFAALYRTLAQGGAEILSVPAAFTRQTGMAHWHVLLRARAIETGCFVIAPAQCGTHQDGRETYGHSLIVNPWGEIVLDAGEAPGLYVAEIDLDAVAEARRRIPSLNHDRPFQLAPIGSERRRTMAG